MDQPVLESSPEQREIIEQHMSEVQYAGFWRRCGALNLDIMILCFISIALMLTLGFLEPELVGIVINILGLLYFVVFEASSLQATPGKVICGIKVEDTTGSPPSFLRCLGRNVAKLLSQITVFIGYIIAGFTPKKQALHDLVAGCVVVKKRKSYFWASFIGFVILTVATYILVGAMIMAMLAQSLSSMMSMPFSMVPEAVLIEKPPVKQEAITPPVAQVAPKKVADIGPTLAEYEVLLKEANIDQLENFDPGLEVNLGPVIVERSTYFKGDEPKVWIKIKMADLPFLQYSEHYYEIDYILGEVAGKFYDLYDLKNGYNNEFFRKITLDKGLSTLEGVYLRKGSKESYLKGIVGKVVLKLPIETEVIAFSSNEFDVHKKTQHGVSINLNIVDATNVEIHFSDGSGILHVKAYDASGEEIGWQGHSGIAQAGRKGKLYYKFKKPYSSIEVLVAKELVEKPYPFVIGETYTPAQ